MNLKRVSGIAVVLIALAWAPRAVPAQISYVDSPEDFMLAEVKRQKWENELGYTECRGECPEGSKLCCPSPSFF